MNLKSKNNFFSNLLVTVKYFFLVFIFFTGCSNSASGQVLKSFEIVSVSRINEINSNSAGNQTFYWPENKQANGVMIILKLSGSDSITLFSSDFSLGYIDEAGIPRSRCLGMSFGTADADSVLRSSWMLGGSMSRTWASKDKPYFGILFEAPKDSNVFELFYSYPIFSDLKPE